MRRFKGAPFEPLRTEKAGALESDPFVIVWNSYERPPFDWI